MNNKLPSWLERLSEGWFFYYANFKLSLVLFVCALLFSGVSLYLLRPLSVDVFAGSFLAVGIGLGLASIFNVLYETKTRSSFCRILADINPNIQSGVIVHQSHESVLRRHIAIERYLFPNNTVRIMTSTADNYVREGEPARDVLLEKVKHENCGIKILLYLPVQEQREGMLIGQRRRTPQELMHEHQSLMGDYERLISEGQGKIVIRFFTLPLHTNFVMIGNERMYSAPILHSISGRNLPCYEIFPTGDRSLFYKFQDDFDFLFDNKNIGVAVGFWEAKNLYSRARFKYELVKETFLEQ